MDKRNYLRIFLILIASIGLNCLSLLLAPFASPDDLGQLAFIIVIFFPASAVITGIISQRLGMGLAISAAIPALTVAAVILIRYNSSGLVYVPIYAAAALLGHLLSWGLDLTIKKIRQ